MEGTTTWTSEKNTPLFIEETTVQYITNGDVIKERPGYHIYRNVDDNSFDVYFNDYGKAAVYDHRTGTYVHSPYLVNMLNSNMNSSSIKYIFRNFFEFEDYKNYVKWQENHPDIYSMYQNRFDVLKEAHKLTKNINQIEEEKRNSEDKKRISKEATELEEKLSSFVNVFDPEYRKSSYKAFAKRVCDDHRTLQQNIFELFLTVIKEIGDQEFYDARNSDAVMTARKITEFLKTEQ